MRETELQLPTSEKDKDDFDHASSRYIRRFRAQCSRLARIVCEAIANKVAFSSAFRFGFHFDARLTLSQKEMFYCYARPYVQYMTRFL